MQPTVEAVLLYVLVLFADNARCRFAIERYDFPVAVLTIAITLHPYVCSVVTRLITETCLVLIFICNAM